MSSIIIAGISSALLYLKIGFTTPWPILFTVKLTVWLFWGCLCPIIFFLGRKFRIDKNRVVSMILLHILISTTMVIINLFFYALVFLILTNALSSETLLPLFANLFIGQFEWYFIIYWGILLLGYTYEYQVTLKDKEIQHSKTEGKLVSAKLKSLKMQLQPHFLFNVLNMVASLVRQNESKKAVNAITGLSGLLRHSLLHKDEQWVPLDEELEFTLQYLKLEKERFGDNLILEIKNNVQANVMVPSFLLQPIVENAVYHGISKKLGAKLISLRVSNDESHCTFTIFNEGPAIDDVITSKTGYGIGLTSVADRLVQLYGSDYTFELKNKSNGVEARIKIPISSNQ